MLRGADDPWTIQRRQPHLDPQMEDLVVPKINADTLLQG
jgi:hypothetical protein